MKFIYNLLVYYPIKFFILLFYLCFYLLYIIIVLGVIGIRIILYVIAFIIALILHLLKVTPKTTSFQAPTFNIPNMNNNLKKRKIIQSNDAEFTKEAKHWGLSNEDIRIAKQERMSPADYIEAEERDDDELVTDEWE